MRLLAVLLVIIALTGCAGNQIEVAGAAFNCSTEEFVEAWNNSVSSDDVYPLPLPGEDRFDGGLRIDYESDDSGDFTGFTLSCQLDRCSEKERKTLDYIAERLLLFFNKNEGYNNLAYAHREQMDSEEYRAVIYDELTNIKTEYIKESKDALKITIAANGG